VTLRNRANGVKVCGFVVPVSMAGWSVGFDVHMEPCFITYVSATERSVLYGSMTAGCWVHWDLDWSTGTGSPSTRAAGPGQEEGEEAGYRGGDFCRGRWRLGRGAGAAGAGEPTTKQRIDSEVGAWMLGREACVRFIEMAF
jgi:hypothetical protein